MRLDLMMLASSASVQGNLINLANGGWDTLTIQSPMRDPAGEPVLDGNGDEVVATLQGFIVIRLLFHVTELDRKHTFTLTIMDEDGGQIGSADGEIDIPHDANLPVGWDQPLPMAIGFPRWL